MYISVHKCTYNVLGEAMSVQLVATCILGRMGCMGVGSGARWGGDILNAVKVQSMKYCHLRPATLEESFDTHSLTIPFF